MIEWHMVRERNLPLPDTRGVSDPYVNSPQVAHHTRTSFPQCEPQIALTPCGFMQLLPRLGTPPSSQESPAKGLAYATPHVHHNHHSPLLTRYLGSHADTVHEVRQRTQAQRMADPILRSGYRGCRSYKQGVVRSESVRGAAERVLLLLQSALGSSLTETPFFFRGAHRFANSTEHVQTPTPTGPNTRFARAPEQRCNAASGSCCLHPPCTARSWAFEARV
jgi:hypothetical protein|mmetsp:Transcript_7169/g.13629  ORF Transcript_7169/g.13629 Transcript_7169/m.13629 type:complete len:221 (+) Transcript_7169:348-1010(+)